MEEEITIARNLERKEKNYGNHLTDYPDPAAARSAARLALQPELGLLWEWIIRVYLRCSPAFGALW
jgi:hypothetical protein